MRHGICFFFFSLSLSCAYLWHSVFVDVERNLFLFFWKVVRRRCVGLGVGRGHGYGLILGDWDSNTTGWGWLDWTEGQVGGSSRTRVFMRPTATRPHGHMATWPCPPPTAFSSFLNSIAFYLFYRIAPIFITLNGFYSNSCVI